MQRPRSRRLVATAFVIAFLSVLAVPPTVALAAPTNDNVVNAFALQNNAGVYHSNVAATMQFAETTQCGAIGATIWYKWTSAVDTYLTVTTWDMTAANGGATPTTFDTIVNLYSGPPNAQFFTDLTYRACNDDQGLTRHAGLPLIAVAGQTYYIQVGGYNAAVGNVKLQVSSQPLAGRDCATTNHFFSIACWTPSSVAAGNRAAWPSYPLNISDDGAYAGGHIQNAVWLYNNPNDAAHFSYMEVIDTGGTGLPSGTEPQFGNNKPYLWERWWKWIDGYTDAGQNGYQTGHYTANYIAPAPSDSVRRHYVLKWEAAVGWSVQICSAGGACTAYATRPWISPTSLIQPRLVTGLEISAIVFNSNSSIPSATTFQNDTMQIMDTSGLWSGWGAAASDTDNPCGAYQSTFCLNGAYLSGPPPYDNWRFNKP